MALFLWTALIVSFHSANAAIDQNAILGRWQGECTTQDGTSFSSQYLFRGDGTGTYSSISFSDRDCAVVNARVDRDFEYEVAKPRGTKLQVWFTESLEPGSDQTANLVGSSQVTKLRVNEKQLVLEPLDTKGNGPLKLDPDWGSAARSELSFEKMD